MQMRGTCTWFLQGEAFQSWKRCLSSFLWLHGIVGCGKTVLSSAIIENLKTEERGTHCVVLYYYFGSDSARDCLDGMVRTFLSQIIAANSKIPKTLWDRYEARQQQSTHAATQSLLDEFRFIISSLDEVKVVLDALDEIKVESREGILTWIKESFSIQRNLGIRIGLIALSRHEPIFHLNFKDICREVQIFQSDIDCDIRRYIQDRLKTIQKFQGWELSSHEIQQIEAKLLKKANGMFRLAALQIDSLRDCDTLDGLQQDLQSLPPTLNNMYNKIIQDINPKRKKTAIRLLQLLAYARRPLRLHEVVDAILIDLTKDPSIIPGNRLLQDIRDYCPSLVILERLDCSYSMFKSNPDFGSSVWCATAQHQEEVDESGRCWVPNSMLKKSVGEINSSSPFLRLAHFSVNEYLRSGIREEFQERHVHSIFVELSLRYLKSLGTILSDAPVSVVRRYYQFSDYAANEWPLHARRCEKDQKMRDLIMQFLTDPGQQAFRTWMFLFRPEESRSYRLQSFEKVEMRLSEISVEIPSPLQIATTFGLVETVKALLDSGVSIPEHTCAHSDKYDIETVQAFYRERTPYKTMPGPIRRTSPLYIACSHGWENIAMLLLKGGLHMHDNAGNEGSSFTIACIKGHSKLIDLLIAAGASNVRDGPQNDLQVTHLFVHGLWKPLQALFNAGRRFPPSMADSEAVRAFTNWDKFHLTGSAKLHLQSFILESTSWVGCLTGSKIVERFMQKATLPSMMAFATPFIMKRSETYLIDFIIRSSGLILGSELHNAVRSGDVVFLKAVLPRLKGFFKGCDEKGKSPLHHAAEIGRVDIICILVSAGYPIDHTDDAIYRPLSYALMNGHTHVLHLLSPDQDSIEQERTRLRMRDKILAAIDQKDLQTLEDFYGAEAHLSFIERSEVARNAFRHAVLNNSTVISDFILSNELDTPARNSIDLASYVCALEAGNLDFMRIFFLDKDAKIEIRRIYHRSSCVFARKKKYRDVLGLLIHREVEEWFMKRTKGEMK